MAKGGEDRLGRETWHSGVRSAKMNLLILNVSNRSKLGNPACLQARTFVFLPCNVEEGPWESPHPFTCRTSFLGTKPTLLERSNTGI